MKLGHLLRIGLATEAAFEQQPAGVAGKGMTLVVRVEMRQPSIALQSVGLWVAATGGAAQQLGHCGDLSGCVAGGLDSIVKHTGDAALPFAPASPPQRKA